MSSEPVNAEERAIKAIAECVGRDGGKNVALRVAEQIRQAEQAAREDERAKLLETHVDKATALDSVTAARKDEREKAKEKP